ncbi:MAG: DUF229 domain-containing protein [Chloroflexi bacterium]|nr:MAG: DUF229 domain-containing protein [Chloroflexota bacterium]
MARPRSSWSTAGLIRVVCGLCLTGAYTAEMRANVLLVVMDTARADAFDSYGAPPGSTPVATQLAQRGRALPAVIAPASWTLPSHAAMFTGLLPRTLGLGQSPGGTYHGARPVIEAHRHRLLPEAFRRAGYVTRAVSANVWISPVTGFDAGFDDFVALRSSRCDRVQLPGLRPRLSWYGEALRARVDDGAAEAEQVIHRWLAEDRRPFFWFVNLIECHSPYLPPRPYGDRSPLRRLLAAEDARRYLRVDTIWAACLGALTVPEQALVRMRHLYARSVRLMDDWLGRVLEALDMHGVLDDTLVVITSDHGENFGEANMIGHSFSLDQRLIHVPLIAAGPGAQGIAVASLVALPRLLAEAVGLSDHPWREAVPDGVAVAQCDPLSGADDPRIEQAVSRWHLDQEAVRRLTQPMTCATDGELKLLRFGDEDRLYDLIADPRELHPMAPDQPSVRELFGARHDRLAEALEPASRPGPALAPTSSAELSDAERQDIEQRMRLLGYL